MFVVFDIGGSHTRVGVSRGGTALDEVMDKVTQIEYASGLKLVEEMILNLSNGEHLDVVVGGIAGVWDKDKRKIVKSPNLPDWENRDIKKELEDKLGCEVRLENDAALGGLGEAVYGAGAGEKIVAYLACGTGVGGARIVNKKIDIAAEPGHMITRLNNEAGIMNYVTLEGLVGGRSLQLKYGKRIEEIEGQEVWEEIIDNLASGIVNVSVMWVPDIVILGGSLAKSIDMEKLKMAVSQKLTIYPWVPKIVKAKLADQAGLWGGLALLEK